MIGAISYEDVMRDANKVAANVRAALYYMADLIEGHNETDPENEVDPALAIQTAGIKFVKPSGAMIGGFMSQFNVLFVQVVPTDPNNMLGHILSPGYYVIPTEFLTDFKNAILAAHAETVNQIVEAYNTPDEDEEYDEDEDEDGDEGEGESDGSEEGSSESGEPNTELAAPPEDV
jgi:hypothetical protein